MLETRIRLTVAAQDILEKSFGQNLPKIVFFKEIIENKILKLFYNESLYYFLCC